MEENKLKVMITGHRPNKLGGYEKDNPQQKKIIEKLEKCLERIQLSATERGKTPLAITGMALGVDQWWAKAALNKNIPCHAYIPFQGQECKWPEHAQQEYRNILTMCQKEFTISPEGYAAWKMHKRDRSMVDDADLCIAVWDGQPGSGTANTLNYIRQKAKPCLVINSESLEEIWENI